MYQETEIEREQERRKSVTELSDLIVSNIAYRNYLESVGEDDNLSVFCNVEKLKVMYTSFLMVLWKDEFIEKNQLGMIHPNLLNNLVNYVAEEKENKYYIGSLEFVDKSSVIEFIRNKIAHGDYLIEEDKVNFKEDHKSGSIYIDDLVDFATTLVTQMHKMQVCGKNKNVYLNVAIPRKLKVKRMKTLEDIKKRLYYLKYIEINDKPYPGQKRSLDYVKLVDDFTKEITSSKKEFTSKEYENIVEKYFKKFVDKNVDIRVSSTIAGQLPNMDKVAKNLLKNKYFREEKDPIKQLNLLAYAVYEKTEPSALKKSLTSDLLLNLNILYSISRGDYNLKEVLKESNQQLPEKFQLKRAIVASQLTAFYIVYIYGFDRIYNADERDHLDKIFEGKMFDFSKLNLSIINSDSEMTMKDYRYFQQQLESNNREKLELMDKFFEIDTKRENMEKKMEELKEEKKEIPSNMIKALQDQKNRLIKTNQKYEKLKRKTSYEKCFIEYNFDDYKKNRSIVEHMRNSITHGNVKVKYLDDSDNKSYIAFHFKDMEDGNITFSTKLTQEEFNTLITGKNLHAISTFLDENTKKYDGERENDTIIPKQRLLIRGKV